MIAPAIIKESMAALLCFSCRDTSCYSTTPRPRAS